jgi:hypothetical protein
MLIAARRLATFENDVSDFNLPEITIPKSKTKMTTTKSSISAAILLFATYCSAPHKINAAATANPKNISLPVLRAAN